MSWPSVRDADRTHLAIAAIILVVGASAIVAFAFAEGTAKDLEVYALAARRFVDGAPLYGVHFGQSLTDPLPYTYPPFLAAVLSAAAWLPADPLTVAWTALDIVLLVWVVRVSYARLFRRVEGRWPIALAALVTLLGLTAPVLSVFDLGQIGLVLLALVLADTVRDRTRLPRGVLVGAATAVKLVPGLFVLYWAITGRRRAAVIASATAVALWALSAVARPDASRTYWTQAAFEPERVGNTATVLDQSMNGVLQRIGSTNPFVWVAFAALAVAIGMYRARRAHLVGDELAAVALVGLATLLASPVSWIHHAVWIIPVTGVVLGDGSDRRRRLAWAATVALFVTNAPLLGRLGVSVPGVIRLATDNAFVIAYWTLLLLLPITERRRTTATRALRITTRPVGVPT